MSIPDKRFRGQYFTRRNVFNHPAFFEWAKRARLAEARILEPFAGANSLIEMLRALRLCRSFQAYDIQPQSPEVQQRDTLKDFPQGFEVIVTNPPYLAKNSAARRGIPYIGAPYDDLYKYALHQCLSHTPYVAAIIPASFLNAKLFRSRLHTYIALPYEDMFMDTEHPVCLALFEPSPESAALYEKNSFLGYWGELEPYIPKSQKNQRVVFNHPQGNLALRAVDGTKGPTIAFLEAAAVPSERIKISSRNLSRILVEGDVTIGALNAALADFRACTHDVFLTPFKGIREDGRFRRRIEFTLVRRLILSIL